LPVQRNVEVLSPRDRLESWKEIAAYLNRSERTVRRWEERESLPVHRLQHEKRGSVYAYTWELDTWRDSRRQLLEAEPAAPAGTMGRGVAQRWLIAAGVVLLASGGLAGWWLTKASRTSVQAHTPNPEAVRAAQKARFGGNAGRTQIRAGIRYYEEAVRIDPSYAAAWAGLANAQFALTWFGEERATDTLAQARHDAQEALKLDPRLSSAWRVLAFASHSLDWDHRRSEQEFLKAIELGPADAVSRSWYGDFLTEMRRFDEAIVYYKKSEDVNPRWLEPITFAGNVHYFKGNHDLALAEFRRALEIEPTYGFANHFRGRVLIAKGEHAAGIDQLRKSNELLGRVPFSLGDLGYALALAGQRAEAERMLADMMSAREKGYYPAFPEAEIHLGLGHADLAMEWLERAADERNMGFYLPSADPVYDPIRETPRFRKLMDRIHITGL